MQESQNEVTEEVTVEVTDSITPIQDQRNIQPLNTNNNILSLNSFQIYLSEHLHISLHFVAEISRTIIAAICFVIIGFICTFAIQWSDYRWKTSEDDMKALVDLGFETIPETEYIILADLFMLSLLVGSVSLNLILAESSIARLIIIRRIFWMLCFLLFFRMITLSVTTLPSPKQCTPIEPGNFVQMLKNGVDLITGSAKACTDNIFSGHSIFITTSVILLRVYCRYKFIVYYSYLHAFVALCLLVATRIHYTVDVILAIFITYAAHSIYFFIVDLCIEKHFLDINRAEDRLGDKDLYQRIAYMPNMFNISLVGAVRWMDGLDIRFTCEGEEILDATRERARRRRLQNSSDTANSEMTEVEIIVNPSQDDVEGLLKSTEDYYNSYLPFQKLYNTTPSILNSSSSLLLISHGSFVFLLLYTFMFLGLAIMWSTFSVPITSFYNNNTIYK